MSALPTQPLWVCDECELIGSGMEAARHADATDHPIRQLASDVSDAVRTEQERQSPLPTAADFIAFARFKQTITALNSQEGSR